MSMLREETHEAFAGWQRAAGSPPAKKVFLMDTGCELPGIISDSRLAEEVAQMRINGSKHLSAMKSLEGEVVNAISFDGGQISITNFVWIKLL